MRPGFLPSLALSTVLLACNTKKTPSGDTDTPSGSCLVFEGGAKSATWTACPDRIRREIRCAQVADQAKCDCYENGVKKTSFDVKEPLLEKRDQATSLANASCRWSLAP